MKLYIKQKVFSFRDRFTVKDESGTDVFAITGEIFSFGKVLHIEDMQGRELLTIRQRLFTFMPRFEIERGGDVIAEVAKEFTFFKPSYVIEGTPFTVQGDFFDHDYEIMRDGRAVAHIYKEWFTWGDSFVVDIHDSGSVDVLLLLAVSIVIDCVMDANNN